MKRFFNRTVSRRKFLEKTVVSSGILVSGIWIPGPGFSSAKKVSGSDILQEGNFPFYPYIQDYNFGEFIPKDQGGKFVQMELIGSEDDKIIAGVLATGLIKKNLGEPPDWSIFEKTELEKSVWFNRFYYLPSFARLYYLNRDKNHLNIMIAILNNWIKENPVEGPSKSKYNWFDMQVAWRSINLSWCYYLGKDGLSDSEKETIYKLQGEHAKILMKDFGKKELNEFNHQSHGALAILYLALLFPGLPESQELLKTGIKILNHHIEHAFYEDGGNVEQMFGYYPFMTSIIRDAYLLCLQNRVGEPERSIPLLKKMYNFLSVIAQTDNTVPPINDSYEETITYIIPTLTGIIGKENLPEVQRSACFRDSQFAVIRSAQNAKDFWYINMNAAKLIGSHDHAGRLAFNVWFNGEPILVDSGCCNYDNPLLVEWYRISEAHNTVLIDGKGDLATSQKDVQWVGKRYTDNKIEHFIIEDDYTMCRMVSPETDETNSGVRWIRDVALVYDKYLIVHDCFETEVYHSYDTIFRFADTKVHPVGSTNRLLIDSGHLLAFVPVSEENTAVLTMKENYFGSHAKNILTPTAIYRSNKKGILHSTFLIKGIGEKSDIEKIAVAQELEGNNCKIHIADESGLKFMIKILDREDENQKIFSID